MSKPIITVRNLGKSYRIGLKAEKYPTFRDALVGAVKAPLRRIRKLGEHGNGDDTFWALKDVSFDVQQGEVVGIIGRNGAGKSTLLKILSRITEPTEGEARLRGRVASLLEVGTGFHPELTGRENIYLNGAILGMRKAEIDRKFDEIVDFSGVEKFIDTPVKRYSSGMYVRLAFAVAAHLEPEILIVDEVLAVGDAEFQKKCLGKMHDVATGEGRTVLFVSHNMGAVQNLCDHVMLLQYGAKRASGEPEVVIEEYLSGGKKVDYTPLRERTDRAGNGLVRMVDLKVNGARKGPFTVCTGAQLRFDIKYEAASRVCSPVFRLGFYDDCGSRIVHCGTRATGIEIPYARKEGGISCTIDKLPISPGIYSVELKAESSASGLLDQIECAAEINVVAGDFYGNGHVATQRWGKCLVDHRWMVSEGAE